MLRLAYHELLESTRTELERLFATVGDANRMAVRAVATHDAALAGRVIAGYDAIDGMRRHVESTCIDLLWRQTPVAGEMRLIASMLEISTDLERIAHHASEIAKQSVKLAEADPQLEPSHALQMAELVQHMFDDTFTAFKESDGTKARAAIALTDEVDGLYGSGIAGLQKSILEDAKLVHAGTAVLFIVAALQRTAERTENIAYHELFMLGEATSASKGA